jgi:hypothetical protein
MKSNKRNVTKAIQTAVPFLTKADLTNGRGRAHRRFLNNKHNISE